MLQEWLTKVNVPSLKSGTYMMGVLVANVCMKEYRGRKEAVVLKLDLKKAYDRIQLEFLDSVFASKGFPTPWRQWIDSCFFITLRQVFYPASKGLRQKTSFPHFLYFDWRCFSLLITRASLEVWYGWRRCISVAFTIWQLYNSLCWSGECHS